DLSRKPEQESQLYEQPDLALVVLIDVSRNGVPLLLRHAHVVVNEHALPRDLHFVEVNDAVVLVEARGERVVEHVSGRRLVGLAREEAHSSRVERNHRSYTVALLTRLQGLNARDHDFVREWNGGAEHLCALERNPLGITVAHAT